MAKMSKSEATFSKPYFSMIADKINNGEKIKFMTGGEQVVEKTEEIKEFLKQVKTNNDSTVLKVIYPKNQWAPIFNGMKWTDIDKAPFSGKGGSGGGAEATALTESMQCYVNSYLFNVKKKNLVPSDITKTNLKKAQKFVQADRSLDKCFASGPSDWMDGGVYVTIANKTYSKYKGKMSGVVYFHRGSQFMNNLYAAKTQCHKKDKQSQSPQAPGSFGNDKWNPGDIWASTLPPNSKPLQEYAETWEMLNGAVAQMSGVLGGKTTLLGISLKKTLNATITEYRDPQSKPKSKVVYNGYIFGKNGDFFSSQDMYIHCSGGEVQCRTFSGATSWQGEIKGKLAAGGKIGGGNIDFYADKFLSSSVFKGGTENSMLSKVNKKNDAFLKEFYNMYIQANKKQLSPNDPLDEETFKDLCKKQQDKFLNSKYLCLLLAESLNASSSNQKNKFMDAMFRYASSDTDQSSYYIKVH